MLHACTPQNNEHFASYYPFSMIIELTRNRAQYSNSLFNVDLYRVMFVEYANHFIWHLYIIHLHIIHTRPFDSLQLDSNLSTILINLKGNRLRHYKVWMSNCNLLNRYMITTALLIIISKLQFGRRQKPSVKFMEEKRGKYREKRQKRKECDCAKMISG